MKFVLVPDSFKGSISSEECCLVMEQAVGRFYANAEVSSIPVADGGEGSVDAFLTSVGGEKIACTVKGPYFEEMEGFYGQLTDGTAVIEMAACAGLPLVETKKDPMLTTTYGAGQLIAHAVDGGCKRIILGLGGSCTNDGGTGCAAALGVRFYDEAGAAFVPTGGTLNRIAHIDQSQLRPDLPELVVMCDIDNPLYGEQGAAYVFGPQKGADSETLPLLDRGLRHLAERIQADLGVDVSKVKGGGAAGGMGAGMLAFFGGRLQSGIETVLDTVGAEALFREADFIFTGEGKLDAQSLGGKVVVGVARRAKKCGTPVIAVVGAVEGDVEAVYEEGISAVFPICREAKDFSLVRHKAKENLRLTMENICRLMMTV